jgi:hypothetical protein
VSWGRFRSRRKEAHERHGGRWLGESNDGFSSASGAAVVKANNMERRGEAGAEGEEKGKVFGGALLF